MIAVSVTLCLGLDVVGGDLHAAVVNGRSPPEGHAPLVVVRHIRLARRQRHGWGGNTIIYSDICQ